MTTAIETAPAMELPPQDIAALLDDLRTYHAIYSPVFQRRAQRTWAATSLQGLLLEVPRTSIEPMILSLGGADAKAVRAMQQCISDGRWDDGPILRRHWQEVDTPLGEEDGVLTVDGRDLLKPGQESVGVTRQYGGEVGKRAHCQAGVCLGDASRHGYAWLDRRLYLPRAWVEDEAYAERRRKCGVPAGLPLQTKLALARAMIDAVCQAKTLRCRWVTCDEACGRDTVLLDQVESRGLGDCAEVPHDTHVWRQRPKTIGPGWSGRGRQPSRRRLCPGQAVPETVSAVAQTLPVAHWACHLINEGSKGPMGADFAALRVVAVRDGLPGPEVWVVRRRSVTSGEVQTSLCNAPPTTPLETLVRLSGMRWPIETCFAEGKQHLGMGD
jgi:SRSO17 transposase